MQPAARDDTEGKDIKGPPSRVQRVIRSWRIVWRITRLNFRTQLEYRAEFIMMVFYGAIWQIAVIVFAAVLLTRFPGLGDWSSADVLLIAGMRMLSHSLYVLVFGRVTFMTHLVQEGRIDPCLLRPMPVYRQVQLSSFSVNSIGDIAVAISMFVAAIDHSTLTWTPGRVAYLVAGVAGGTLIEAAIFTALSSAAFHFPASYHWSQWVEELMGTFGNYPLSFLPGFFSGAFTFILPLAFIAYFPAGVLTGRGDSLGVPEGLAAASPLIGLIAFVLSRLLWNWSLSRYSGVNA